MASSSLDDFFARLETLEKPKPGSEKRRAKQVEIPFELLQVGYRGEVQIKPNNSTYENKDLLTWSNYIFPHLESETKTLENQYFEIRHDTFPSPTESQRWWPRQLLPQDGKGDRTGVFLLHVSEPATTLRVDLSHTGEEGNFTEIDVADEKEGSMSLLRQPGALEDYSRGSTENYPFMPGGVDKRGEVQKKSEITNINDLNFDEKKSLQYSTRFL